MFRQAKKRVSKKKFHFQLSKQTVYIYIYEKKEQLII